MRRALALALTAAAADACGMTVHMVIANRALNYYYDAAMYPMYKNLLINQTGALLGGASTTRTRPPTAARLPLDDLMPACVTCRRALP